MTKAERRAFELAIVWAAWWLHSRHGQDQFAEWLIAESLGGRAGLIRARRLAREEDYQFRRGFWAEALRQHQVVPR